MNKTDDPIGQAIADYYEYGQADDIVIQTNYTEDETLSPGYFFRNENQMPFIEQKALSMCRGKILDVGAAAGSHALALQRRGLDVTAIEISPLAASVMKKRGIEKAVCTDLYHFNEKDFDTIIVLMNGTGIGGTRDGLKKMLLHLKGLLSEGGRILIDSSDIIYLMQEDDGSVWINLADDSYYGEMQYEVSYRNHYSRFNWLFAGFDILSEISTKAGFSCKMVTEGEHFDYLAELKILQMNK